MSKIYQSMFLLESKVDLPNSLAEILIFNYVKMRRYDVPSCPFWRKEYRMGPILEELGRRYVVELVGVKQLLKQFSGEAIASYFKKERIFSFKMMRKHNQIRIREGIASEEVTLKKQLGEAPIISVEQTDFVPAKSFKVKKGKLDL